MEDSVRGGPTRFLAGVVFLVLAAVAVAGFTVTRSAAEREEKELLRQRASEIAVILSTSANLATSLQLLGEVYASRNEAGVAFAAARSLVVGGVTSVGVAQLVEGAAVVRAVEGTGTTAGAVLTGGRDELVRRALAVDGLASTIVPGDQLRTFVVALGRPDGLVVFEEAVLAPPEATPPAPADSPFAKLDAALFRAPAPDPENLILAITGALPMHGPLDSRELVFGSERWLLQTSARSPLGSAQARAVPWIILGPGLGAALLAGGIVALLARRRAYALGLVHQRTADLRHAMAELEAARATADAANKAKSQFLSRMSHELRTPLNSVLGFAQLLQLNDLVPDDRDAVDHIVKGGNHLLTLINEVLDISRIESGDLALSSESVLAEEVIAETVDLMRPLAAARSIHLLAHLHATEEHYVFADRQRLKQVLLNLLSNAVKYNRLGGTVSVGCEQISGTRLRLKVADTGPGISVEDIGLLFVPFERLGANHTEIEGSGIGLALSRRLAESMDGTLQVESSPGKGSTFWIELPLVEGAVERYERLSGGTPPAGAGPATAQPHRVLYVEDNLTNITLVRRILAQRPDIELIPAMQGRLGVELAHEHRPALILLDLHLPDISGDEVLQHLRDDPETSSIPVVVVSADATMGQIQRLQTAGASAYLTKPFNVGELLRTVTELLGAREADTAR